jgi:hypothetical protein
MCFWVKNHKDSFAGRTTGIVNNITLEVMKLRIVKTANVRKTD